MRGLRAPGRLEEVDPMVLRQRADEMDRDEILSKYTVVKRRGGSHRSLSALGHRCGSRCGFDSGGFDQPGRGDRHDWFRGAAGVAQVLIALAGRDRRFPVALHRRIDGTGGRPRLGVIGGIRSGGSGSIPGS